MSETTVTTENALNQIRTGLESLTVTRNRPRATLTIKELDGAMMIIAPIIAALEEELSEALADGTTGAAWYGVTQDGEEFTGDQKKDVLTAWYEAKSIPPGTKPISTTLGGEQKEGERVRGDVYFYTHVSRGRVENLWLAKRTNRRTLEGFLPTRVEEESTEEE